MRRRGCFLLSRLENRRGLKAAAAARCPPGGAPSLPPPPRKVGVATAQLYPDIELGLSAGSIGVTKDAFTSPTNFWNLGGNVNWQANQDGARARISAAKSGAKLALANFDGTVLQALREAESALNNYVHDLQKGGECHRFPAIKPGARPTKRSALSLADGQMNWPFWMPSGRWRMLNCR